eukprot:gene11698-24499_t
MTREKSWNPPSSDSVQCLHILKKHSGSRRPASWRNPNITAPKEVAINEIQAIHNTLVLKAKEEGVEGLTQLFMEIAKVESDCSSAAKGGDLGPFGRALTNPIGQMQKAFEDASFALNVGELSEIVDTDSGIHVILRVG